MYNYVVSVVVGRFLWRKLMGIETGIDEGNCNSLYNVLQ